MTAATSLRDRPVLFIHSLQDDRLSDTHPKELWRAAGGKDPLWIIPDAGHTAGWLQHREVYETRVTAFMDRALLGRGPGFRRGPCERAGRGHSMTPPAVHLGTQGWSYPDWVGTFYPPGSRQEDYLPFYAEVFDTVELDTTFYHPPKPTIVLSWARHTPGDFRFAAKVPQAITHTARLASMGEQMQAFALALEPLGERLGPLLVQMPAEFERDPGTIGVLDRFLAAAPGGVRLAIEFRHRSWHHPATWTMLRARRAAAAWTEWRDLPRIREVTTDFLYLRWMGHREAIERFDRVQIDRADAFASWEADLRRALPEVREVYGYFNNHWAGHSPASANEMKRRLGLVPVEWKERWTQRELF